MGPGRHKPLGKVQALSCVAAQETHAREFIHKQNEHANVYYHVNPLNPGVRDVKAKKADVAEAHFLHVDIDDMNGLERLGSYGALPTAVVFSGGGYQAFWRLEEPCSDLERVERLNLRLARDLGGDNCQNVDRIMRLPGTINRPNAKKRASGRKENLAHVIADLTDWSRSYPLTSFAEAALNSALRTVVNESEVASVDLDQLPARVTGETRGLIHKGDDPDHPIGSESARYPSRSEVVFRVTCDLARADCSPEVIAGVLINPKHGISASIREKSNPTGYAARQAAAATETVSESWPDVNKGGTPRGTFRNALLAVLRLGLHCEYDEFHRRKSIGGHLLQTYQGELSDDGCAVLRQEIIQAFGFDPGKENTREAANTLCLANTFNPVKDYLRALKWDGEPRLEKWLSVYLGADDNVLNGAIGKIMLIAGVRRVRQPGVKFDTIVVLEGPQGTGKSTALKLLAGGDENFSDQDILTLGSKEQMEALEGVWIFELCELEGISRAETSKVKAFASRATDRGRPAYGRFRETKARQNIFVGTTNDTQYLRDTTGNRRFWPVTTGAIDLAALERDRDQLWAEAAHYEGLDESITLDETLWPLAAHEQQARMEHDPWLDALVGIKGESSGNIERISTNEILTIKLEIPTERQQQFQLKRVAALMRQLGWNGPKKMKIGGKVLRGYDRPISPSENEKEQW